MTLFENKLVVLNNVFLYQFLNLNCIINLLGYTLGHQYLIRVSYGIYFTTFVNFKQILWFLFYENHKLLKTWIKKILKPKMSPFVHEC